MLKESAEIDISPLSRIPRSTVRLTEEFVEVSELVSYRGKTHMAVKDQTTFEVILDNSGNEVAGVWESEWTEAAPGIETRYHGVGTRTAAGQYVRECYCGKQIRISRPACPVRIKFLRISEYTDYESNRYSSRTVTVEWTRYEA